MYQHLTQEERYEIYEKLTEKVPKSEIASGVGKHISSIYREINRNKGLKGYRPKQANDKAAMRQAMKPRRVYFTAAIRLQVESWLRQDFSPEQIVGRAKHEGIPMVSHERIYQHIWKDKHAGGTLYEHLRHIPKKYRKRYGSKQERGQMPNTVSIDTRPAEVESRDEIGHWEIDTVIGKSHDGAIVTLVERTSRFTVIGKLVGKHAEPCAEKTIEILTPYSDKVKSITADNGKEFAKFERIAEALEALFFFAHPHHPWERGTNENTNGLIRQYLPKSMGFESITQEDCQKIMDILNNRPRKVLGFRTPVEVFFSNMLQLSHL
jgi:transposase, IS30 family